MTWSQCVIRRDHLWAVSISSGAIYISNYCNTSQTISQYFLDLCSLVPPRLRNFLVGMTNIPPSVSSPTVTTAHSLCATYNASVDPGSTVSVACDWNASPGRYLFIQIQGSMETLSLCEVQVYVRQTGGNNLKIYHLLRNLELCFIFRKRRYSREITF